MNARVARTVPPWPTTRTRCSGCAAAIGRSAATIALAERLVRLAGLPAVAVARASARAVGVALLDLRPRQALPARRRRSRAARAARRPRRRAAPRRSPPSRARGARSLVYTASIRSPASCVGERARLRAARLVERRVGVALEAAARGSSRSRRGERGGAPSRRSRLAAWISGSATVSASSPARPAASGSRPLRLLVDEGARVVTSGRSHAPNVGEALHVVGRPLGARRARGADRRGDRGVRRASTCSSTTSASPTSRRSRTSPTSEWEEMWQLNVMSYVRAIRAVLPQMRERGARRDRQRLVDRRQAAVDRRCRTTP